MKFFYKNQHDRHWLTHSPLRQLIIIMKIIFSIFFIIIPPATKFPPQRSWVGGGGGGFTLSVCLSVCQLTFCVCPVASTVQDGFFPYLVQMINSMREFVAYDDPLPWPISSSSFSLYFENPVRSVVSTVPGGFFLYLAQMITIIRGCVACYVFFNI